MSKLFLFCLIILGSSTSSSAQDHPLEELFFERLAALFFTNDGIPVVVKDASDYKVAVIDSSTFQVHSQLIRKGKGPGEIDLLNSFGFNYAKNEVCLIGFELRLVCSDLNNHITKDSRIPWLKSSGISTPYQFYIEKDELLIPLYTRLSVKNPANIIKVAAISTFHNLQKVSYLTLSLNDLGLTYLDDLSLANNIFLKPRVLKLNDSFTLVCIAGMPYFYIFEDRNFIKRIKINTSYEVLITVSIKPEFPNPGIQTPANINNLQLIDESHFLVSHGNSHQDIPLGIDVYQFQESGNTLSVNRTKQIKISNLPEEVSEPNVTLRNGNMFIITNYHFLSSQIFFRSLQ
tara:strand:- start:6178 stop:7215 length:1038 start_codon:yes stop_codon:yes gene_type:complete